MIRLLLISVLLLASAAAADARDIQPHFFDPSLGDFKAELSAAKSQGKKGVLLMFELEDCPFCLRMKQTILNQPEVQEYYRRNFLIFSVDAEGGNPVVDFGGMETTEKKFALGNRVRATPVFLFFDLSGKPVARFTGAAKDAGEFLALGRYVVEGAYERMPFAKYKQLQGVAR